MKLIPLTRGLFAKVDDKDYERLSQWKWYAHQGPYTCYAGSRRLYYSGQSPMMHRLILDAPRYMQVDHIDGDGLNNTRANIRLCSRAENAAHARRRKRAREPYRGVRYDPRNQRWQSHIKVNNKFIHLGMFPTAEGAATAYDRAARHHFGRFARPNFDEQSEDNSGVLL